MMIMKVTQVLIWLLVFSISVLSAQNNYSDCSSPLSICNKNTLAINKLYHPNTESDNIGSIPCYKTSYPGKTQFG